jgi:hypothetical protein
MINWRYFEATGQAGGTTSLQYVDSYNGDDTNSGSHLAPKKSIQAALDGGSNNMILILAGYFKEGDFVTQRRIGDMIAEGYVILDGENSKVFNIVALFISINKTHNYGIFEFRNFTNVILSSVAANLLVKNCKFVNCKVSTSGAHQQPWNMNYDECTFVNSEINYNMRSAGLRYVRNCTFINTFLNYQTIVASAAALEITNCYFCPNSRLRKFDRNMADENVLNPSFVILKNNLFRGSLQDKFKFENNNIEFTFNNTEQLQAGTDLADDDLPSTTDPLLNGNDYTLQFDSPLRNSGVNGNYIGAYSIGKRTFSTENIWSLNNVTLNGDNEFVLSSPGVGTVESDLVEVTPRKRQIKKLIIPNLDISVSTGSVINSRLASFKTPYLISVEIQYSIDGVNTNGSWLKVPLGIKPFHDIVNDVGNDDPNFNLLDSQPIICTHLKYKITLRDNEIPL